MHQLYFPPKSLNIPGRVILSISQEEGRAKKRITVLNQRFLLPTGFTSVDVIPLGDGIFFKEAGSSWPITQLGCRFENAEEMWAHILPLISEVYAMGLDAGRSSPPKHSVW